METKKIYEEFPYQQEFQTRVVSCQPEGQFYRIQLEETCFFPESGGQSGDTGYLNEIEVIDTQIIHNQIVHITSNKLDQNQIVQGRIDWDRRFDFMQHHTGEHIFSGLAYEKHGTINVGFHLSDQSVTLDLDQELTGEQILELEKSVNQVIWQNHQVTSCICLKEELKNRDYRSKKELEGAVRLITISQIDCCACCAPHVKETGQIGLFFVKSIEKYKGGLRLEILCGGRALRELRVLAKESSDLCRIFSSKPNQISENAKLLQREIQSLKRKNNDLQLECASFEITSKVTNQPFLLYRTDTMEPILAKKILQIILQQNKRMGMILVGTNEQEFRFFAGATEMDLRELLVKLKELYPAKGGGSKDMIQGNIQITQEEMEDFLSEFLNK